jgi:hypothetical protein
LNFERERVSHALHEICLVFAKSAVLKLSNH